MCYPSKLCGRELLDYFDNLSDGGEGDERVHRVVSEIACDWILVQMPLSDIPWMDSWVEAASSRRLIKKYSKRGGDFPPVILDHNEFGIEIVDGFHRIAAAKARGDLTILAYYNGDEASSVPGVER